MTDISRDMHRDELEVEVFATVSLKELFAALFRSWEAAVEHSSDDPEHVHELRVASRRVTAALRLFEDFLPRRKTDRLLSRLDVLRKSAGLARDCDVFAARVADGVSNEGQHPLTEYVRCERLEAQRILLEYYEECERGERFERQAADLIGVLRPRSQRAKRQAACFHAWASRQLRTAIREFFDESDVDPEHLEHLHQFRIRVKQLRYYVELLQPVLNRDRFKKAYSGLKKLSQRLGEINDHVTAASTLSRWLDADFDETSSELLRRWRKDERRLLQRAVSEFVDWWTPRRQCRLRRKLKQAAKLQPPVSLPE